MFYKKKLQILQKVYQLIYTIADAPSDPCGIWNRSKQPRYSNQIRIQNLS